MTLIVGFVIVASVIFGSFGHSSLASYLQWHSIVLVVGGSIGLLVLTSPLGVLKSLMKTLAGLVAPETDLKKLQAEMMHLARNKEAAPQSKNLLIKYASELWEQGVDSDLFVVMLSQKRRELENKFVDAAQAMKNLSKYPPALGMVGTVMGMVALFQGLDSNKSNIGLNLSLAMTATFYGLILANTVISPLADRIQVKNVQEAHINQAVYELLLLINRGESESFIEEELRDRAA